jgi:hypothetical protein
MSKSAKELSPPLHSVDPADWFMYLDLLLDSDAPKDYTDIVWKIGRAMELEPKLTLVASRVATEPPGTGVALRAVTTGDWDPKLDYPFWDSAGRYPESSPATPADFPGLVEYHPSVAWDFYRLAAERLTSEKVNSNMPNQTVNPRYTRY